VSLRSLRGASSGADFTKPVHSLHGGGRYRALARFEGIVKPGASTTVSKMQQSRNSISSCSSFPV